ncbi:MAG: UvrD-helicase domain-containing protein, partial [Myxococcota bacterium]
MNTLVLPFGDDADRNRIRRDLETNLLVEAAAGTGKTYELVMRTVTLLAEGHTTIERLVIVTFTRKAAGELQLRLRVALDAMRADSEDAEVRARLGDALANLEEAQIGTIHGFCAHLLRTRPVEARIDPDFVELSESQQTRLHAELFRKWVEMAIRRNDPTSAQSALSLDLERALRRDAEYGQFDDTPIDRLAQASRGVLEWRDHPTAWRRDALDLETELERLAAQTRDLADMLRACTDPEDPLVQALQPVLDFDDWRKRSSLAPNASVDIVALEEQTIALSKALSRQKSMKATYGPFAPALRRHEVEKARDELKRALGRFRRHAEADLAAGLQAIFREVGEHYRQAKAQAGYVDYLDLLLFVRDMLVRDRTVRNFLQERYSHLLIDEFQDTDALQAEILLLLAAEDPDETDWRKARPGPGRLFLVGDPKQSIYRFRRADIVLYQQIRAQLRSHGVDVVYLSRSFRATRAIQDAINIAFEPEMVDDHRTGQAGYVPITGGTATPDDQPSLVALPIPRIHNHQGRTSRKAAESNQPHSVAAWIDWLLKSEWTVRDTDGTRRKIESRDICILFSRFKSFDTDLSQGYVDALDARQIPHVLVGTWSFKNRPEIDALTAALTAIEWPDDDLSVYAALRGPLFSLPDGLLLRYRAHSGRLHPFATVPDELPEDLQPVADGLALLR